MSEKKDYVYFDLETRYSAAEVGGWHRTDKMGVSVAVTYSTLKQQYRIYTEDEIGELIEQLRSASLVIGYNHLHFDYAVLQPHCLWDLAKITNNLDLCTDINKRLGRRLKLDAVATASLGLGKTAVGTQALTWWAEYVTNKDPEKLMEIARYCCFDVKVTMEAHLYGQRNGFIRYESKDGFIENLAVEW